MREKDDTRPFRIQGEGKKEKPSFIPWWLAEEAYKYYSEKFGKDQSLERINERGGFGRVELISFLRRQIPEAKP